MVRAKRRIYSKNSSRRIGPKNPKIWKIRKDAEIYPLELSKDLTDEKLIAQAFWECLRDNDPEGAMEMIAIYLREVNKLKYSKEKNISRSTLYRSLSRNNLTIKTVAKILHSLSEITVKKGMDSVAKRERKNIKNFGPRLNMGR